MKRPIAIRVGMSPMDCRPLALVLILSILPGSGAAQLTPGQNDVYVRVVDGGAGLCTITEIPGPFYMVYDAGHWQGSECIQAVHEIVDGDEIDLMVISHTDADHLGQADRILDEFFVYQIVRVGQVRSSGAWEDFNVAVANEVLAGASVTNLQTAPLVFGDVLEMGGATITFVAGYADWTGPGPSRAERRNAVSIVVKLTYHGRSVLLHRRYDRQTLGRFRYGLQGCRGRHGRQSQQWNGVTGCGCDDRSPSRRQQREFAMLH